MVKVLNCNITDNLSPFTTLRELCALLVIISFNTLWLGCRGYVSTLEGANVPNEKQNASIIC